MAKRKTIRWLSPAGAGLIAMSVLSPALAHHSAAGLFDMTTNITIRGSIERFEWKNPHIYIHVAATDAEGRQQVWRIEGFAPGLMRRFGWSQDTLRPGDKVKVLAHPSRSADRLTAHLYDISVEGRSVPAIIGSSLESYLDQEQSKTDGSADSLSGTWITVFGPATTLFDDPSKLPLTAAGRAAVAAFDQRTMLPGLECTPTPAPRFMVYPDVKSIEIGDDIGWIRGEFDGSERTIYFDGREPAERTVHGHSLGHFEGDVLVIETTHFADHLSGNAFSLPSGSQKRLVERLAPTPDGTAVFYSFELTDPEYLSAPVKGQMTWLYRPSIEFRMLPCDAENARRFVDD